MDKSDQGKGRTRDRGMLYVIIGEDATDGLAARLRVREAHVARIRHLLDDGRLVVAGPCPALDTCEPGEAGFTGSLIIAEFDNIHDADSWAQADPYLAAGAWYSATVWPFIQTLP